MPEYEREEPVQLTTKRKRIMIYFIEATRKLIQTEGLEGVTIRKIAAEAGYNSATLYNYFRDLNHLVLFGSVCYLRDYVILLSKSLREDMTSLEYFRTIYRCFNDYAFQYPEIFHNLFFGRHSDQLGEVLATYYTELFPEELAEFSDAMRKMMVSGNMRERDWITMQKMIEDHYIAQEKAAATVELIVSLSQSFIYEACVRGDQLDIELHKKRFNELFDYILAMAAER